MFSFVDLVFFWGPYRRVQRFASTVRHVGGPPPAENYGRVLFLIIDEDYCCEIAASPTFPGSIRTKRIRQGPVTTGK